MQTLTENLRTHSEDWATNTCWLPGDHTLTPGGLHAYHRWITRWPPLDHTLTPGGLHAYHQWITRWHPLDRTLTLGGLHAGPRLITRWPPLDRMLAPGELHADPRWITRWPPVDHTLIPSANNHHSHPLMQEASCYLCCYWRSAMKESFLDYLFCDLVSIFWRVRCHSRAMTVSYFQRASDSLLFIL